MFIEVTVTSTGNVKFSRLINVNHIAEVEAASGGGTVIKLVTTQTIKADQAYEAIRNLIYEAPNQNV